MSEARKARQKLYYLKNRERILEARRAYREKHPEKVAAAIRRCWDTNGAEYRERQKATKPSDRAIAARRAYQKSDALKDRRRVRNATPKMILSNRIRSRMNRLLKIGGEWVKTKTLVDYTIADLRRHIELQFVDGMGWHNAKDWHIDHIIPLSSFSISGPEDPELKRAWALSNLRPIWARDNLRKHCKVETLL